MKTILPQNPAARRSQEGAGRSRWRRFIDWALPCRRARHPARRVDTEEITRALPHLAESWQRDLDHCAMRECIVADVCPVRVWLWMHQTFGDKPIMEGSVDEQAVESELACQR